MMNLQSLFSIFPGVPENAYSHVEITGIFNDANKVISNSVFAAIRGSRVDGHEFITQAITNGAIAIVVEKNHGIPPEFTGFILVVPDTRAVLDILAARYFGYPAYDLFCVGVTGTNGKTSITYMVESIFNRARIPMAVIGTVNHHLGEKVYLTQLTTPDAIEIQNRLRDFCTEGARALAIEVSSHALAQKRVDSIPFNCAVFTNLTHDHLDYHKTMKSYFDAKQRLFRDLLWRSSKSPTFAIVNIEDSWGRKLVIADPAILWTYGAQDADFEFHILKMDMTGTLFELKTPVGRIKIQLPLIGIHNVYNATAAIAAATSAGITLEISKVAMESFLGTPGRLQMIPNNKELAIFVDYAHTPDALENVLLAVQSVKKSTNSNGNIITIFGCGGDRDKTKRPLMAEIAVRLSNRVIVTSDNPRTEDPLKIIEDIINGVPEHQKSELIVEPDRRLAITQALVIAKPQDIILIFGKGHENYQIIGNEKRAFDDFLVTKEILAQS